MDPIVYALSEGDALADEIAGALNVSLGKVDVRRFPDGESWLRVRDSCEGRQAVVVADLCRPDDRLVQLLFLAHTLRDLGAGRTGLVAPYLAYMRQDERFRAGEGVTARYFADLMSTHFDWLATVDPHLHRLGSLQQIYAIPTFCAHSAPHVAQWLADAAVDPVLIGPDAESEQWVNQVAKLVDCPHVIFEKTRHGDRDVEVHAGRLDAFRERTPVILDDIISTGTTMAETIVRLREAGLAPPICVGIHGVFADEVRARLIDAGAAQVVTCNTIGHPTNAIDVRPALIDQVDRAVAQTSADAAE